MTRPDGRQTPKAAHDRRVVSGRRRASTQGRPNGKSGPKRARKSNATAKKPKARAGRGPEGIDRRTSTWLGQGAQTDGAGALIVVREVAGSVVDERTGLCTVGGESRSHQTGRGRKDVKQRRKFGVSVLASTCGALAAVGHVQRAKILTKLLEGPATYRSLQKLTKLKPGPLYHHINQLRLSGLMLPKQRDLYELTRGGRNVILIVAAMGRLIRDKKRRPAPTD